MSFCSTADCFSVFGHPRLFASPVGVSIPGRRVCSAWSLRFCLLRIDIRRDADCSHIRHDPSRQPGRSGRAVMVDSVPFRLAPAVNFCKIPLRASRARYSDAVFIRIGIRFPLCPSV